MEDFDCTKLNQELATAIKHLIPTIRIWCLRGGSWQLQVLNLERFLLNGIDDLASDLVHHKVRALVQLERLLQLENRLDTDPDSDPPPSPKKKPRVTKRPKKPNP